MALIEQNGDLDVPYITSDISSGNSTVYLPIKGDEFATAGEHVVKGSDVTAEVVHCSLPNLSPIHCFRGTRTETHSSEFCKVNSISSSKTRPDRMAINPNRHTIHGYALDDVLSYKTGSASLLCPNCVHAPVSQPISAYCSPRAARKQRPGSFSSKDLSSLRADCYLKSKRQRGSRSRLDSEDSAESDRGTVDSASHISTCATSDYAFMTSLDTISMLCKECAKNNTPQHKEPNTPSISDNGFIAVLRRTYSCPEINTSAAARGTVELYTSCPPFCFKESKSYSVANMKDVLVMSKLKQQNSRQIASLFQQEHASVKDEGVNNKIPTERQTLVNKNGTNFRQRSYSERKQTKSIAISEENLVSRVSRWLSTVDNGEILETDTF